MKKLFALSLAVLLTMVYVVGFVGCGQVNTAENSTTNSEAKSGGTKVELEFFNQKVEGQDVYNKLIEKFQKENPNIIINQIAPQDAETVFFTRLSTNDIPDVMSIYPAESTYQNAMKDGVLAEITNEPFAKNAEDFAIEMSKYNGKLYAMPFAISTYGIFYNEDMFSKNNISKPETWDQLIEICKKFKAQGIDAFSFPDKEVGDLGQQAERFIGIAKNDVYKEFEQVGKGQGSFKDSNMDYVKATGEAILQLREYATKGSMAMGREQVVTNFVNGKNPMFITGSWNYALIKKSAPDLKFEMMAVPNFYKGQATTVPINVDIALGYSAKTKYPEECKKFIEFLSKPENNQMLADEEGTPTVIKGVNYNIEPLQEIRTVINTKGKSFLTIVNFWPAGFRSEWVIHIQNLLMDKDMNKFIDATDTISKSYYTKQ